MKLLIAFGVLAVIALTSASVVPAATLIRAPQYDSAIIQSDRIGGNFAYSTVEGHAYKALTPLIRTQLYPYQYGYHFNPIQFGYPPFQQVVFGQPIFSGLGPISPIEIPTQPASPAQTSPPASQGTAIDNDTVAIEAA